MIAVDNNRTALANLLVVNNYSYGSCDWMSYISGNFKEIKRFDLEPNLLIRSHLICPNPITPLRTFKIHFNHLNSFLWSHTAKHSHPRQLSTVNSLRSKREGPPKTLTSFLSSIITFFPLILTGSNISIVYFPSPTT